MNSKQQRKRRKQRRQRKPRAFDTLPASLNDDMVLTFSEWCTLNGIGERNGRRILERPGAPVITRLSARRIGITVRHNREWQQSRATAA
jgi:hypothetical protein